MRTLTVALWLAGGAASCGPLSISAGPGAEDAGAGDAGDAPLRPVSLPGLPDAGPAAVPCPGKEGPSPASCAAIGVVLAPPYDSRYTCLDLGPVPGVTTPKYGGLSLSAERCSSTLIIGVDANAAAAKLYAVEVTRDLLGHVNGFAADATVMIDAPYHDGGVAFGPGGVLFITRWPVNEIQQTKPGSAGVDKVISLDPFLIPRSASSLNFVPANLPGGGALKLVTFGGGDWFTLLLMPDGLGTYDIVGAKKERTLTGGPEGFVYVAAGSPLIDANSVLVSEWSARRISLYETDQSGNPKLDTSHDFITGLSGAEGAYRDPTTGDFFFSTWGHASGDRVIVVRGFTPLIN
jgi:hypothetical protein